ncbi:MAG: hypothetical protein ACRD5F_15030 [Candidatus Acidiferrales bacterium]
MAKLKSIDLGSAFKVCAVLYALLGLVFGAFISLFSVLGFMGGAAAGAEGAGAMLFGTAAIVVLPIFYGIIGAIGGVLMAAIYNFVAGLTGGLEITLQ